MPFDPADPFGVGVDDQAKPATPPLQPSVFDQVLKGTQTPPAPISSQLPNPIDELQKLLDSRKTKATPKKLSGPTPNPKGIGDPKDYPAWQVPDRIMGAREIELRKNQDNLQKLIREDNAKGFDVSKLQQQLFNVHENLKKFGGSPYRSKPFSQTTRDYAESKGAFQPTTTQSAVTVDPYARLPFTQESFQHSIDHELSVVQTKEGLPFPLDKAMKMVGRKTNQTSFASSKSKDQIEAEDNGAVRNLFQEHRGNDHDGKKWNTLSDYAHNIASVPSEAYENSTGLSRDDAPYAHAALDFLGGLAAGPSAIGAAAQYTVENPIQAVKNVPGLTVDFLRSINPIEPGIQGHERFGRMLNLILAMEGGIKGAKGIRSMIQSGELYRVAGKMGIPEAEAKALAIQTAAKATEIKASKLNNEVRLNAVEMSEARRARRNSVPDSSHPLDDPFGVGEPKVAPIVPEKPPIAAETPPPAAPNSAPILPKEQPTPILPKKKPIVAKPEIVEPAVPEATPPTIPDPTLPKPIESMQGGHGETPLAEVGAAEPKTVEPTPVQEATVGDSAKKERKGKAGLTPTQQNYLSETLKTVSDTLPEKVFPKMEYAGGRSPSFVGFEHGPELDRAPSQGVEIEVPGDGKFTVHSKEQAAALHKAILGTELHPDGLPPHPSKFFGSATDTFHHGEVDGEKVASNGHLLLLGEDELHDNIKAHSDAGDPSMKEAPEDKLKTILSKVSLPKAETDIQPAYVSADKKVLYLKGKDGNGLFGVSRKYADTVYKRGYELTAPSEEGGAYGVYDPKTAEIRGAVSPYKITGEPETMTAYKKPKPAKVKVEKAESMALPTEEVPSEEAHPSSLIPYASHESDAALPGKPKKKKPTSASPTLTSATPAPTPSSGGHTPPSGWVPRAIDAIKTIFSPASRTPRAGALADVVREYHGDLNQRRGVAQESLREARNYFQKRPLQEAHDFIDRLERGQPQADPHLDKFAKSIRDVLDTKRDEIRGFGRGWLSRYYDDYFPHLWQDPKSAGKWIERMFTRKPLQGGKKFMKQRSIPYFSEGLARGLKPISDNPIDLVLAQAHQMDKFITAQKLTSRLKSENMIKYVRAGAPLPDGWSKIDDPTFTRFGSGEVEIHEAYDEQLMSGLQKLANDLGVPHTRSVKIPGQSNNVLGLASRRGKAVDVQTKFGSPETVLTHELGHAIDYRFNLKSWLNKLPDSDALWKEGRELGRLRYDGHSVSKSYDSYVTNKSEVIANLIHAYVHAPHLLEQVAPNLGKAFDGFVKSQPKLKALAELKPSLVIAGNTDTVRAPGMHILGQYAMPSDMSTVLNNYLSPGLRGKWLYNQYQCVNNLANLVNLSMSARHLVTTSLNSMISDVALGFREGILTGSPKSLGKIAKGALPAVSAIEDVRMGKKIKAEFLKGFSNDPQIQRIINGVISAGGDVSTDRFYVSNYRERFMDALHKQQLLKVVGNAGPALAELSGSWMMEKYIPHIKLGAFGKLLEFNLDQAGPNISEAQFRRIAAKSWDSIDNRFGQLQYDTLFWNKTTKDMLMASVRSVGWNMGTIREVGGGGLDALRAVGDLHKGLGEVGRGLVNSDRIAYSIALTGVTGLYGAILGYALTGEAPKDDADYFFPRTGKKNADGTPERMSLPTYMRDVLSFIHDPATTIAHKSAPFPAALLSFMANQDYRGTKIRNEDDPFWKQGIDVLKEVGNDFLPFTISGQAKAVRDTGSPAWEEFAGLNRAPSWVDKSKAVALAEKYSYDALPRGSRTSEEADKADARKAIVSLLRNGQKEKAIEGMKKARFTNAQVKNTLLEANRPRLPQLLKHLKAHQAVAVLAECTPEEKKLIQADVLNKVVNAIQGGKLSAEEAKELIARYKRIAGK
jgi:hypothetical protein